MTERKLEILIVEDNPKHLADAQKYMNSRIEKGALILPKYAQNYLEAKNSLDTGRVDGIISDIFFQYGGNANKEIVKNKCIDELNKRVEECDWQDLNSMKKRHPSWIDDKNTPPLGVLISKYALANKLPIIFCTDTYHHGHETQIVHAYTIYEKGLRNDPERFCIEIVDGDESDMENIAEEKNWGFTYGHLIRNIIMKNLGFGFDSHGIKNFNENLEENNKKVMKISKEYFGPEIIS